MPAWDVCHGQIGILRRLFERPPFLISVAIDISCPALRCRCCPKPSPALHITIPNFAAMFENIPAGPPDVMYYLKKKADEDTSPEMVDVGVGIYRDEEGKYQELDVVRTVI